MRELPVRSRAAIALTRLVNGVSRRAGAGSGTVIGGRIGLAVDPRLVTRLSVGRPLVAVSGTNGKTTTTRLLAAALGGSAPVTTNVTGANMPEGHAAALAAGPPEGPIVLEVDEGYLPRLLEQTDPATIVLLNLSRDQLDRTNEVRMLANRWRSALGSIRAMVVANADDPLVAWSAAVAPTVTWVAAGMRWRLDSAGCPSCGGRIDYDEAGGWSCRCGFARPTPSAWLVERAWGDSPAGAGNAGAGAGGARADGTGAGGVSAEGAGAGGAKADGAGAGGAGGAEAGAGARWEAVWADGRRAVVALSLPGRFNAANALMAAVAAESMGMTLEQALAAMATIDEVGGRFAVAEVRGRPVRLLLAKNPAGWNELLDLVCPGAGPVVVSINARVADGRDPSWLWDVPFERLRGRPVMATGERALDLAVRLRYAEVDHETVRDPLQAVRRAADAAGTTTGQAEFIGNYTAFHDVRGRLA